MDIFNGLTDIGSCHVEQGIEGAYGVEGVGRGGKGSYVNEFKIARWYAFLSKADHGFGHVESGYFVSGIGQSVGCRFAGTGPDIENIALRLELTK